MNPSNDTILLAEDDLNEVFLMQRAFQKANLTNPLQVANDGQEAIDYLSREAAATDRTEHPLPSLILLDLKMPRKNGFEVLEWLRQQPGLRRTIVVVMSSSNQISDINRAYDLGANSYLVKPVDFKTLLDLVKSLVSYWLAANRKLDLPGQTHKSATALQPA